MRVREIEVAEMGFKSESYLDIPAVARKGILSNEQYDLQRSCTTHKDIEELTLYRYILKQRLAGRWACFQKQPLRLGAI